MPARPLVSRETRTTPSPTGRLGALQVQAVMAWRHTGQVRPTSVEYTKPPRSDKESLAMA